MEIWSGLNFTGDRAECTGACGITQLGSVGNDRARSARCTCAGKWKTYNHPLQDHLYESEQQLTVKKWTVPKYQCGDNHPSPGPYYMGPIA